MKLNCKPGDLAYVTAAAETPGLAGRLVIVEELAPAPPFSCDGLMYGPVLGAAWICRSASRGATLPVAAEWFGLVRHVFLRPIHDDILRPIGKPGDHATDEMLLIAGLPVKDEVPA